MFVMVDWRIPNTRELLDKCAIKYNESDISTMKISPHDEGVESPMFLEYSVAYDSKLAEIFPHVKMLTGPGYTANRWETAGVVNFQEKINKIISCADTPPIIPKAAWYGSIYSAVTSMPEHVTRPLLKTIGDAHPDLFDIRHIQPDEKNFSTTSSSFVPIEQLTQYKYLIDIGGQGFSGRTKYLLFTKRPLLYVTRRYREWFSDEMVPWKHYVPVEDNLRDLVDKTKWLFEFPEEAQTIAMNAFEFAMNHFTEDKLLERVYEVYKFYKRIK
jgi:hypothetical protein